MNLPVDPQIQQCEGESATYSVKHAPKIARSHVVQNPPTTFAESMSTTTLWPAESVAHTIQFMP